jgi:hypothetical protein
MVEWRKDRARPNAEMSALGLLACVLMPPKRRMQLPQKIKIKNENAKLLLLFKNASSMLTSDNQGTVNHCRQLLKQKRWPTNLY